MNKICLNQNINSFSRERILTNGVKVRDEFLVFGGSCLKLSMKTKLAWYPSRPLKCSYVVNVQKPF